MTSRASTGLVALALVVLLASAPLIGAVGVATAASDNSTTTATPEPTATTTPVEESTSTPIGTSTATATPTATPTPEPEESSSSSTSSGYGLEELKRDGTHLQLPSVRMGDERMMWLVYWPANNPFAETGSAEGGEYLPEDHTVGRNAIWLRTWTHEDRETTVHVVYWQKGQKTVERGNSTTTVPVARNVTEVEHEVDLERGRPTAKIPLKNHREPTRVTMWVEGSEWARWTFAHHSIATTQNIAISSQGDYLTRVILDFLLWIVVGGFAVGYASKRALDRAGIGPQYGYGPWVIGLSVVTALGSLLFYRSISELVVNAQYVLAAYVVAIIGIVMLETYTTGDRQALFLRPTLEYAESPTGDDAHDIVDAEVREERIVRSPDGDVSVVTPGVRPFLARVFGRSARLQNVEQLRTRVPLVGSSWDELFIVDPEADDLLKYVKEGWELSPPPLDREHGPAYGLVGVALLVAGGAINWGLASPSLVVGAVGVGLLLWLLEPVDGIAGVEPAPMHLRTAMGTMINFSEDLDDAKRFDEVKDQLDRERVQKQRAIDREVANHDQTLVEEMLDPEGAVPATVERDDDELVLDDEVVDEDARENGSLFGGDEHE